MTTRTMASFNHLPSLILLPLLATLFVRVFPLDPSTNSPNIVPFKCSARIDTCNALLYHTNHNLSTEEIASHYSVNSSQIEPITRGTNQDYLITVSCSCRNTNDLIGYFYDTNYTVKLHETLSEISTSYYNGQAWPVNGTLVPDTNLTVHLPCGCSESDSQIVVTYTVQQHDTITTIANLLSATITGMQNMNEVLAKNPSFIDVGWVLYVPRELNGIPSSKGSGKFSSFRSYVLAI